MICMFAHLRPTHFYLGLGLFFPPLSLLQLWIKRKQHRMKRLHLSTVLSNTALPLFFYSLSETTLNNVIECAYRKAYNMLCSKLSYISSYYLYYTVYTQKCLLPFYKIQHNTGLTQHYLRQHVSYSNKNRKGMRESQLPLLLLFLVDHFFCLVNLTKPLMLQLWSFDG